MVAPTICSSTTQESKSKFLPKTGKQKVNDVPYTCVTIQHTQTQRTQSYPVCAARPRLFFVLCSVGTNTSLSPYLGLLRLAVPPSGISPGPSLSPVPSAPRPLSSPRPEALLLLWRGFSCLSPRGSQSLWSTAKVLSKGPEPPLSVTGLESLERTQRGVKGEKYNFPLPF